MVSFTYKKFKLMKQQVCNMYETKVNKTKGEQLYRWRGMKETQNWNSRGADKTF